ncbi:MAG: response regulator [Dehalococcoidia bacterium]
MSVLVVEDNPISAKALQATLTRRGHDTAVAYTGVQAIDYLEENPQVECVVVDLILPEMDGFQLIRRMQQSALLRDIPVVICTTLRDMAAVQKSARLGCRHYLVKPVGAEELVKKINDAMADGLTIMENPLVTREQLDLDQKSYEDIVLAFGKLLDERMNLTYAMIEDRLEPGTTLDYSDLEEGARLLGAQKLLSALSNIEYGGLLDLPQASDKDIEHLLREFAALERLLRPARRTNVTI